MTCEDNVNKGRQLAVLIRTDDETALEILGGVRSRGAQINNPSEEVTSSSTTGEYAEREWTGFSDVSINVSGVADRRTGIIDPSTGLNIVGAGRIQQLATSGNRTGYFRLFNISTQGYMQGCFIVNLNINGDTPGLLQFDGSLESKGEIQVFGEF